MKSFAVIGTPSDQTALGFSVYTIVSGPCGGTLTTSDCAIRFRFAVATSFSFTVNGLGSTAPRTIKVPGVSPAGVCALHPVGLCVMPKEMAPPPTPT